MNTLYLNEKNQKEILAKIIDALKSDMLIISPTDTVYGAIVNAQSEKAVKKLIMFKNRPVGKPISVFVSDFQMLADNIELNHEQSEIIHELLPGPFTVILKSKHQLSPLLESEKGTLGIRLLNYPLVTDLVSIFGKPLTATSANVGGHSPHYQISSLLEDLPKTKRDLIDLIVDGGKLPHNKPSTVVDLTAPDIKIVRHGDIVFQKQSTYQTTTPIQTEKIGQYLLEKYRTESKTKPLIFIIQGELGVGKTQLIKGMGKALGVNNIISPTYVIYYEYDNFYHFDLYNIQDKEEFPYLGIDKLLQKGNILTFEWGEKSGEIIDLLKAKGRVVYIQMKYISEKERKVIVKI